MIYLKLAPQATSFHDIPSGVNINNGDIYAAPDNIYQISQTTDKAVRNGYLILTNKTEYDAWVASLPIVGNIDDPGLRTITAPQVQINGAQGILLNGPVTLGNSPMALSGLIYQTHTDANSDIVHDAMYSHFISNNDGYNVHAIREGTGGGGAIGGANTGTGAGAAIVGNRYGDGAGEGGSFVRIGNGTGHGIQATQNSTGAGHAIQGIKTGPSAGHGIIGVQVGTGAGHGVVGDVQSATDGHGVYAVIEGGGTGDALRAFNVNGTGYAANMVGGKGARVQSDPVAFGPIKDIFTLTNNIAPNDAYALKMGTSFDGGGLSHFIRHFFGGNVYQQISFDHATHIRFGINGANTTSITNTGVTYHTTAEPPVPSAGDVVEWYDGTNKKWKKSDGTTGIIY